MRDSHRALWWAVIHRAVLDATHPKPNSREAKLEKRRADEWFRGGGRDFQMVCAMAGVDAAFIREAYLAGKFNDIGDIRREAAA